MRVAVGGNTGMPFEPTLWKQGDKSYQLLLKFSPITKNYVSFSTFVDRSRASTTAIAAARAVAAVVSPKPSPLRRAAAATSAVVALVCRLEHRMAGLWWR
jgi:hypothetical protein